MAGSTFARGLLDRLSSLMGVNVAILGDKLITDDADLLRLVDTRHISEAIELIRLLTSHLGGTTAIKDESEQRAALNASLTGAIGSSGQSCWVRHLLAAAAFSKQREAEDTFTKSFRNLLVILNTMKRAVGNYHRGVRYRNGKQAELVSHIRKLPQAYYTFRSLVEQKLVTGQYISAIRE